MRFNVVFNSARELRLLGILSPRSGTLTLSEQFRGRTVSETELKERVAKSLRRHAVFGKVQQLIAVSAKSEISLDTLAMEMPALFPAVAATAKTWRIYAISFGTWLDYSGLLRLRGLMLSNSDVKGSVALLASVESQRRGKTFPHSRPDTALCYLRSVKDSLPVNMTESARQKVLTDLFVLGLLDLNGQLIDDQAALIDRLTKQPLDTSALLEVLVRVPGGKEALTHLAADPSTRPELVGAALRDAFGLPWASSTTQLAGAKFRAWAKAAGLTVLKVRKNSSRFSES